MTSSGPIVVALHGFTGCGLDWELPVETFGREVAAWFAPDLPGHGGTTNLPSDADYSLAGMRAGLRAFIRTLPRAPILMGYSFGGRAAIEYAVHDSETLAGLLLIGATAGIEANDERAARVEADAALAKRLETEGIESFADYWETVPLLRSQADIPNPWGTRLRARRRRQDPCELARSLRAAGQGAMIARWHKLRDLHVPALCTYGEHDIKFGKRAEKLAREMPDGSSVPILNAGHSPQWESASDFQRKCAPFLRNSAQFSKETPETM